MPKVVNHEARRREIIDVVWRLIATDGLEAVTTRRIAEASGYANGVLLYYFKNKDEVITAAFEYVFDATNARVDAICPDRYGLPGLRMLCLEVMPLDHTRYLEARIVIAFWQQALSSPERSVLFRERMLQWREEMSTRLEQARIDGDVSADVDIAATVDELMAMLMGLQALAVLTPEDTTPERQLAQLDAFFARLRN
ncbi:TetR/AcrR family transcriptional regulator [Kocuria rosea]|jgi:AcrR family transcriptional regulator|uniref:TetR/AcrR family transcriptional regulator n=1 Tax=Kocuria rosea TaxID=1275 RepID=A0A4R5Y4T2_KOCRO|nr:TetR family transcriptional regulator C-terminal domain-containing protein [Kocuria rosea]TDL38132.1 TetR/AcrR family transcriptional regulator [Kocuria rosea]